MDPELDNVFTHLVQAPNRAKLIEIADAQIMAYRRAPDVYIIPNTYRWATPLVEHFAQDMGGWHQFGYELADRFPKRSEDRMAINDVLRRILGRWDAEVRRERLERAIQVHEQTHGALGSRREQQEYATRLQTYWKILRLNALRKLAVENPTVSQEDRALTLAEFWGGIGTQIDRGNVPARDHLAELTAKAQAIAALYEEET